MASPAAVTVVVTSIAAPSTSPVIPPNRRTQCPTISAATASATMTTTGPCHGRGPAATDAAATPTVHAATTTGDWVPATSPPSTLPSAAGMPTRHAQTAATLPAVTAVTTAAQRVGPAGSCANDRP